jgi:hypothetical protein
MTDGMEHYLYILDYNINILKLLELATNHFLSNLEKKYIIELDKYPGYELIYNINIKAKLLYLKCYYKLIIKNKKCFHYIIFQR